MILGRIRRLTFGLEWCWYDLYVGLYWDREERTLYGAPLPTCVFWVHFGPRQALGRALEQAAFAAGRKMGHPQCDGYHQRNAAANALGRKLGAKPE